MKTSNWIILAVVLGVLAMAGTAQAAFLDAISVNISTGGVGDVSGSVAGATDLANNWINTAYNATGIRSGPGGTLTGTTSNGNSIGTLALSLYSGGWGGDSAQTGTGDYTLVKNGWRTGTMPNQWGEVRMDVRFVNVPSAFTTAGYNVYGLAGSSMSSLAWVKYNATPLTTADTGLLSAYTDTSPTTGVPQMAGAYQVVAIPEPVTMSLLAMGGLALLLRRKSKIRRGGRS